MAAAVEGYKAKRTHDDCDGAGSSNYEPHPKRIERLTEFMASEYEECAEELGDRQESSESDLAEQRILGNRMIIFGHKTHV